MSLAVLLWAVYVWLSRVRLITDIDGASVSVRMRGLPRHARIPLANIAAVRVVCFDSQKDFGGYGFRAVKGGRAFIGTTSRGVRLDLVGGAFAIIGSALPEDLVAALKAGIPPPS